LNGGDCYDDSGGTEIERISSVTAMKRKKLAAKTIFLPEVDIEILDHELEEDYLSHVSKKKMKNSLKEKEIEKQMIDHEVEKRTVSMKKLLKKETPSAILEKMKNDDQAFMEGRNEWWC
jgi:hypothetical protein